MYYKLTGYSIDSLAHACVLLKSKLPIFNFRLLAIFVTDGAMVDVGFAAPDLQARAWTSHGELNPSSMLAVGLTIVTASIDIFTGCKIANRIAGVRNQRASAANAELHQLACVVSGDAPS